MSLAFLCHPYHRGGVTKWMADAFNQMNVSSGGGYFISVIPRKPFFSSGGQPLVTSLLSEDFSVNVFAQPVDRLFEFGTLSYKASIYSKLILRNIETGIAVIASDDEACWMAAASCARRNPFIAVLHGDEELYYQLAKKYREFVTAFICVSNRILGNLIQAHPDIGIKSTAIPCGIFVDQFRSSSVKSNDLIWVGRVSRYQKRASDIIPIFNSVRRNFPSLKMSILGNGDYQNQLEEEVKEFNLESVVKLHGWVDRERIKKELSGSKIFIQTSDFEGTSIAMMEALASGCMIVSTRVSGVEDLENVPEAKGIVFLYQVGAIGEVSEILKSVLTIDSAGLKERARFLAETYFDIQKNNLKILNFIQSLGQENSGLKTGRFHLSFVAVNCSFLLAVLRWYRIKNLVS